MKMKPLVATLITGMLCHFAVGADQAKTGAGKAGPREIITQKIKTEVAKKLQEAGASFEGLKVTVAEDRDSATPFDVSYRGLKDYKTSDGSALEPDGKFLMEYAGGGQWQGKLGGMQIVVPVATKDNIDLPFVDDPKVIGEWKSVDFIADPADFNPAKRAWKGDLYLKGLTFLKDGKTPQSWWTWTKGVVMHHGDKTASKYRIRKIKGEPYLFFEWKSGDVTISGMKPHYYVLKKESAQ